MNKFVFKYMYIYMIYIYIYLKLYIYVCIHMLYTYRDVPELGSLQLQTYACKIQSGKVGKLSILYNDFGKDGRW